MRLFVYLHDYPADGDRQMLGIAKAVHGLSSGLAKNGCETVIICQGSRALDQSISPLLRVRRFKSSRLGALRRIAPGIKKLVEDLAADKSGTRPIFLLNGIFNPRTCAMARLLHRHGVRYIVAPHDPYSPVIFNRSVLIKWSWWLLRERQMLRDAAAIQILDPRHAEPLVRLGVATPIIESVNGFAESDVTPESALHWNEQERPSAFFLGRLDAYNKGLDVLIRAFAGIAPTQRPSLTLQGPDWGDARFLRSEARRLELGNDVRFAPADFRSEATDLIARHDIFCLVSRFEGFGLAALEAMLAGRVLVVSDDAGISAHVRASGCGLVVNPSAADVRTAIMELLRRRSEWKAMGLAGRKYALTNLRWDRIARQSLNQYQMLFRQSWTPTRPEVHAPAA